MGLDTGSAGEAAGGHRTRARGALDRDRLAQLVDKDFSVRQIAAEVDRSPTTVRHWLARQRAADERDRASSS